MMKYILSFLRWMGICLLGCLVEQCDTELFSENCLSWLKTLIQILQVKAVFQLRVFYMYVHAHKSLNPFLYYI